MAAYYNEFDPNAAAWLRALIAAELIPPGDVDTRSITEVCGVELKGYTQCHFFAGIGGWPLALRYAGIPADRPLWTGSCPCQPYSVASLSDGGPKGQSDDRDLWPDLFRLIAKRRPPTILGEQVASAIKWGWWDRAAMDLERETYACAAAVLRADAFAGQHQRKRLYWVADAQRQGRERPVQHNGISGGTGQTHAEYGDTVAHARRALAGDFSNLLSGDGVSVGMERRALKGYGNAIHIGSAVAFIKAAA